MMSMRNLLHSLVLSLLTAVPAGAQDLSPGWIPTLEIRGIASAPNGSAAFVSGDSKLTRDEPFAAVIRTSPNLCTVGMGMGGTIPLASAQHNIWKVTGEYLGELGREGRFKIRVTSGFTRVAGRDASDMTTQTLILREGDTYLFDAVSAPPDGPCQVHTVAFEGRLVMRAADPALARATYTADLWLVHTDPGGREQREHLIANVGGPAATPFMFNRLSFSIPVIDAQQGEAEAFIQLTGALRTRARTDGLVDVDIDTNRMVFGLDRPERSSSNFLPLSRKTLTLKPGETTAIEFPPPSSGYMSLAIGDPADSGRLTGGAALLAGGQSPSTDGPAVEIRNRRLVLHIHRFFKGHRTQMLITLRRAR